MTTEKEKRNLYVKFPKVEVISLHTWEEERQEMTQRVKNKQRLKGQDQES